MASVKHIAVLLLLSAAALAQGGGVNVSGGKIVLGGKVIYGGSGPATCTPVAGHTYTTAFPATENPIKECAPTWINGLQIGLSWSDCATTPAFAFGTQASAITNDSTCILQGTWNSDQQVIVTAKAPVSGLSDTIGREDEIRLRSTMIPNSSTGYEIDWGPYLTTTANCYLVIVRWNGPFNNFTYIANQFVTSTTYCHTTGDILSATVVGSTIRAYKNGVQQLTGTANDTTYTNGTPGFGFDAGATAPVPNDWGYSAFTANDNFVGMGQSVALQTAVSGTTVAPTMPTNTTTGNLISCAAYWADTARTATVSDVANGTYTAVDSPVNGGGTIAAYRSQSFYKASITGATTPVITLTLSGTAATVDRALVCHEAKGVTTLDQHPAVLSTVAGTPLSNTTGTTTAANEYIHGWCVDGSSTLNAGWSLAEYTNFGSNGDGFRLPTATGTFQFGTTTSGSDYLCGINTFK